MGDKYACVAWNALMEEESKESIAELYLDSLDSHRAKDAVIRALAGAANKAYTAMAANDPFDLKVWTDGVDALDAALALAAKEHSNG